MGRLVLHCSSISIQMFSQKVDAEWTNRCELIVNPRQRGHGGDSEQGKVRSRGGTLKIKITRPTGTDTFSRTNLEISRVRKNSSDNYIKSLQIPKTPTYPNVQKNGTIHFLFS